MSQEDTTPDATKDDLTLLLQQLLNHRFARIQESIWTALWAYFLQGIAFGLGSFLGATIVVYFLVMALGQLEFIPIVGDLASELIAEINTSKKDTSR